MNEGPLPMGLGVMLMQNEAAMQQHRKMTEAEKEKLLYRIRGAHSEHEKRRLAAELKDAVDNTGAGQTDPEFMLPPLIPMD